MKNISGLEGSNDNRDGASLPAHRLQSLPGWQIETPAMDADDIGTLIRYVQVLWHHKWKVSLSILAGFLISLGVSLWITPLYQANTSLEVQAVRKVPVAGGEVLSTDPDVATQVQLLSSTTLRDRAKAKLEKNRRELPKSENPLDPVRLALGLQSPEKTIDWETAVSTAMRNTRVTAGKDNRILIVETRAPNPSAAAAFVNTLAEEYLEQNKALRWDSYQNTTEWLARAQQDLKEKVEESERRLQDFAQAHGLIITASQNSSEERFKQLQNQLAQASSDRITRRATYESSLSSPTESLPAVLDSGPMAQYQVHIADLRRQLADLTSTLTPDHYRVKKVEAQLKELEAARDRERTNIISRIRIDYESAQKRERELEQAFKDQANLLSGQAKELIQYNILSREAETNKKLYEQTLEQAKEASLASAMSASNARVVDPAKVSLIPLSPNLPLNLALGIIGGFLCSALFVVVRTTTDTRIQEPGNVELHVNLPELGIIPSAGLVPGLRSVPRLLPEVTDRTRGKVTVTNSILIPKGKAYPRESLALVTWTRRTSVIAEAFRAAMASILFSTEKKERPQALVITSAASGEGKTTVTTNLAIALAEINRRVVMIDADMRIPRLHSIFDLPNSTGLSDFLHDRRAIEEYTDEELVHKTHIPNVYVMSAGPARSNLARLLYSQRMNELLSRLRISFDAILLDSPPVMSVPDARILARVADGVVLVVRAHQTYRASAFAAVRRFEKDGSLLVGTILNDWNPRKSIYGPYGPYAAYKAYGE